MTNGWPVKTLDQIATNLDSQRVPITKADRVGGKYPYYGASGIVDYVADYIFDGDTLLVSEDGANLLARSTPIAFPASGKYWVNNHAHILKFDDMATQRFVEHFLESIPLDEYITDAAQPKLNQRALNSIPIPVPPLAEQQRIVGILDEAFEGIATATANAEKNLQNARALFESHLQSVFTQRGEGWVDTRLADICDRVSVGHVGPTSEFYCDPSDGIPFLRSQNVRPGKLDWDGVQYITKEFHDRLRKSQIHFGDLLFVRVGANRGDCCAVLEAVAELNCANIVFARPTHGNAAFLERYCQSPPGRAQLLGMTTGSAQGVINTSSVAELVVPLPKESDQETIVNKFDDLHEETQRLATIYKRKLAALDDLKKSLLHQAFSGNL